MANYYVAIKTDQNGLHSWTPPTYLQTYTGDQSVPLGDDYYDSTWGIGGSEYAVYEVDTDIDFPNGGSTMDVFAHTNPSVVNGGPTSVNPGESVWNYAGENYWTPTFGEDEGEPYTPIYVFSESYTPIPTNTWRTISGGKDIYVNLNNLAKKFSINVAANTTYTFTMYTYSENNWDGIMISTNGSLTNSNIYLNSSASSTPGYINHCTGLGTTKTATYTPTSSGTVYVYFKTDTSNNPEYNNTGCSYGRITWVTTGSTTTITLNANGGSGGTGSVTGGYGSALPSITVPTRSGLVFMGYYDTSAISGGTEYYNSSGTPVRNWDKTGSTYTLYARWLNKVTWIYNTTNFWCTLSAVATSTTTTKREVTLAMNPSCGTGTLSATLTSIYNDDSGTTLPSSSIGTGTNQWTLSSDGKKLNVPAGVSAANYEIRVTYTSPSGLNYTGETETASAFFTVAATYVTEYGNVYDYYFGEDASGEGIDPGDLGDGVVQSLYLTQIQDFPASAFTMSESTVSQYFENVADYRQWVTYNNGATRAGTVEYDWTGNSTSFSSLGTTEYSEKFDVTFNTLTLTAIGEGGKSAVVDQINGGTRSANVVTWNAAPAVSYSISSYTFPAAGGTYDVLKSNVNAPAQTGTWTSGSSASFTPGNSDINLARTQNGDGMTVTSSGVTNGLRTSATNNTSTSTRGTMVIRARVTYKNGTTKDAFINFTQAAGSMVYENPVISHTTPVSLSNAGEEFTMSPTFSQAYTWNGVSGSGGTVTSGATYSYAVKTSKTGYSLSSGKVSVTNNTSTSARNGFVVTITCSANSKSSTKDITFNQPAGSKVYAVPTISTYSYATYAAAGATKTPTVPYSQTWTWNGVSGSGGTITSGGTLTFTKGTLTSGATAGSSFASDGTITWGNNTTTSTRSTHSALNVTVALNGKTSSAKPCSACTQSAGSQVYANPVVLTYSYADYAASGETKNPTVTYKQDWTWNGVSGSGGTITSGGTLAFTASTLPSGCSKGTGTTYVFASKGGIVWASRGTTTGSARDAASVLSVTVTLNSKTSSSFTCTSCKQEANGESAGVFIFKYSGDSSEETFSGVAGVQKTDLPASALTLSTSNAGTYFGLPAGELFQQVIYTSGQYALESLGSGSAVWSSPGAWTGSSTSLSSLGTTATSRSSVNINTLTLTFTSRFNHSESKTFTSGMREANVQGTTKYKDTSGTEGTNITYTVPSCTINSDALTAAGGTFYVNCYVTNNTSWYYRYTSGSYKAASGTASGNARWRITSQTFTPEGSSTATAITRFSNPTNGGGSYSSMTLYPTSSTYKGSHSSMTTNAGTDSVTVTAYNLGDTSKTKTATATVTNSFGTTKYKNTSGTTGYNIVYNAPTVSFSPNTLSAAGGYANVSCSVTNSTNWYYKYTSGSYSSLQEGTEAGAARWRITKVYAGEAVYDGAASRFHEPSSGGANLNIGGTNYMTYYHNTSVTHDSMTNIELRDKVTVTAYNINDTSKSTSISSDNIVNELGTTKYKDTSGTTGYYSQTYGKPSNVTIGSGITAGSSSASLSCTCDDTFKYYLRYTSGTYTSLQTDTHASTITWSVYSRTFIPEGGSSTSTTRFSVSGSTLSHSSMTSNVGTDRVVVRATNANSTSKYTNSSALTVTNELGTQPYKNTSGTTGYQSQTYGTPSSVTISSGFLASGGSATASCTCDDTFKYYLRYTSGTYTSLQTDTHASTITWSINSQTFTPDGGSASTTTRFSISGSTVSHSSMGTNVGTDTVTVKATNANSTSKTGTGSKSVTNAVESISLTVGNNPISFGSSTNATVIATYTSTATQDVSASATYSSENSTGIVSIDTGTTVTEIYVDDYSINDSYIINSGGVREYLNGAPQQEHCYEPYGTITYEGVTRYLWKFSSAKSTDSTEHAYIVTTTNDPLTLLNSSSEYNVNNIFEDFVFEQGLIVASLYSDRRTYNSSPTGMAITKVVLG